ncbi:hypothetical protein A7N53_23745, partial [Salmonella enterica subsp. enterica serovar Kintambo]|nr:hypothetical protein [Salmonella enterica]EBS0658214.1 hypothetical protein [Salmonella enterica subsp. enterica serovar Kintambo]EBM3337787.1 hypothetical protein [Salmonella enterica]EBS4558553.1 hypothetical protein [Salmonella enterica subsp. enterica serovar Kintambo]EBU7006503.1 hypothetical protein [Salmonella enterica subsp. enterica serovar Kintambo]
KLLVFAVIFLMKGSFLDLWLLHQTYYRLCKTAPLPYLKRFRKVCISISRQQKNTGFLYLMLLLLY